MKNLTQGMTSFRQMEASRYIISALLGVIFGSWLGDYIKIDIAILLTLALTVGCIAWYLPILIHEAAETNDQLAGRSPELHEFIKGVNRR